MKKQTTELVVYHQKALTTLTHIRRELASVYSLARKGQIDTADMTKYTYTLKALSELILKSELEERVIILEKTLQEIENAHIRQD